MAGTDLFQVLVQEFKRLWLDACRERLERLKDEWEPWIRAMLTEPLQEDWQAEVDRFVENTRRSIGLIIKSHSIRQIEDLVRSRAEGTGVFASLGPAPLQSGVAKPPRKIESERHARVVHELPDQAVVHGGDPIGARAAARLTHGLPVRANEVKA